MNSKLTIMGLSGGIATGKSTCAHLLKDLFPETVVFDADVCVKELYTQGAVIAELRRHFGNSILGADGRVDFTCLRQRVFSNPSEKEFLEQVFHPKVREECLALLAETATSSSSRLFVADIPLLFENGFDLGQSLNLLVATSKKTQVDRLKNRNTWDDKTIEAVLSSQIPIEAKLTLADVIFWNEGPEEMLHSQCSRFLKSINLPPLP